MKIKLLTLITITAISVHAQNIAPAIDWAKCFGGTKADYCMDICSLKKGGFAVTGFTYSNDGNITNNHGNDDYWVIILDNLGNLKWQKTYGGTGYEFSNSIKQTTDGGLIIAGYTTSNDGDVSGNHGGYDCWLLKLDSIGNIQWQKALGGSGSDDANEVLQTMDKGYIIVGTSTSNDGDVSNHHGTQNEDIWLVKLDTAGKIQWQKSYGSSNGNDVGYSIAQTTDSGYIVAGSSNGNNGDVSMNKGGDDLWVFKISKSGTIQWEKTFGGSSFDDARSVKQTTDKGYIVAGYTASIDGDLAGINTNQNYWVIKLDSLGNIQWNKTFGGSDWDNAYSIEQTTDKGYILTGTSNSNNGDVAGANTGGDYWVVKLDSLGNLKWQKPLGGSNSEEGVSIKQTVDGGYIVAGDAFSNNGQVSGNHGINDFWIVKLFPQPLPVELYSFKVQGLKSYNSINWQTATEINTSHFNIQRSITGKDFTTIGKVTAKGASEYTYNDNEKSTAKTLYYRLEIVDKDGTLSYSEVRELSIVNSPLSITPNPAKDNVTVSGANLKQVKLLDNLGRVVTIKEATNSSTVSILVSHLAKGIYMAQATFKDGSIKTEKLVVE